MPRSETVFTSAKTARLLPAPEYGDSKEYWHPAIAGFGVRVGKPRKKDAFIKRTYISRFSERQLDGSPKERKLGVGLVEPDGTVQATSYEAALSECLRLQQVAQAGTNSGVKVTLADVWKMIEGDWARNPERYSPDYIRKIRGHYSNYLSRVEGRILEELDSRFWIQFIESARDGKFLKYGPRLILKEAASQKNLLSTINYIINFATERELVNGKSIDWRPTAVARKRLPAINKRTEHIDAEALGRAWRASNHVMAPGPRDLFRFAILTGLRDSLLTEMRFSQIDFELETIKFPILARGTKRHANAIHASKLNSYITLPLSSEAVRILRERQEFSPPNNKSDYVWYNLPTVNEHYEEVLTGTTTKLSDPRKSWARIARFAGFNPRKHDLRRTFASIGGEIEGGASPRLSRLMMHTPESDKQAGFSVQTARYIQGQLNSLRKLTQQITDAVLELAGERPTDITHGWVRISVPEAMQAQLSKETRTEPEYVEYVDEEAKGERDINEIITDILPKR